MVSNTIQCGFESHPGHRDGRDVGACVTCHEATLPRRDNTALLGYYLGDGCVSSVGPRTTLRISRDALPAIIEDVARLIIEVRPRGGVLRDPAPGVRVVHADWKHRPGPFPQHGPGRKHERVIALEPRQQDSSTTIRPAPGADCSTATVAARPTGPPAWCVERKSYDYPRRMIVNRSEDIIELRTEALNAAGVQWRRPRINCVAVSRAGDVRRLDELIGMKA